MGEKWGQSTAVRLRDWQERIEDNPAAEEDITISLAARLETILYLRDVQDLRAPRMYAV